MSKVKNALEVLDVKTWHLLHTVFTQVTLPALSWKETAELGSLLEEIVQEHPKV